MILIPCTWDCPGTRCPPEPRTQARLYRESTPLSRPRSSWALRSPRFHPVCTRPAYAKDKEPRLLNASGVRSEMKGRSRARSYLDGVMPGTVIFGVSLAAGAAAGAVDVTGVGVTAGRSLLIPAITSSVMSRDGSK